MLRVRAKPRCDFSEFRGSRSGFLFAALHGFFVPVEREVSKLCVWPRHGGLTRFNQTHTRPSWSAWDIVCMCFFKICQLCSGIVLYSIRKVSTRPVLPRSGLWHNCSRGSPNWKPVWLLIPAGMVPAV